MFEFEEPINFWERVDGFQSSWAEDSVGKVRTLGFFKKVTNSLKVMFMEDAV